MWTPCSIIKVCEKIASISATPKLCKAVAMPLPPAACRLPPLPGGTACPTTCAGCYPLQRSPQRTLTLNSPALWPESGALWPVAGWLELAWALPPTRFQAATAPHNMSLMQCRKQCQATAKLLICVALHAGSGRGDCSCDRLAGRQLELGPQLQVQIRQGARRPSRYHLLSLHFPLRSCSASPDLDRSIGTHLETHLQQQLAARSLEQKQH